MILINLIVLVYLTRDHLGCNGFPQESIPVIDKDLGDLKYFLLGDDHIDVTTATLLWSNNFHVTVTLENTGVECMYQGSYPEEISSVILVTGCKNEGQDILIQSSKYGDILGTVSNGIVELLHPTDSMKNDSPIKTESDFQFNVDVSNLDLDLRIDDKNYYLDVYIHMTKSWHESLDDSERRARYIIETAQKMLQHISLDGKLTLLPKYKEIEADFEPSDPNKDKFSQVIPFKLKKPGIAHIMLTGLGTPEVVGIAETASICDKTKTAVAIVQWNVNTIQTAQTVAHEIGHLIGMYHDFDPPNKDQSNPRKGRHYTCDDQFYMMGYITSEDLRSSEWSECSNEDFKNYWLTLYTNKIEFCLLEVQKDLEVELFEAIDYIDTEWLTELLEEDSVYVNAVDDLGWTPLMRAVTTLNEEMVNILLNNGADVNIANGDKKTALTLLEEKMEREDVNHSTFMKIKNLLITTITDRQKELYEAAKAGNLAEVRQLILQNTFVDGDDNEYNFTPLIIAVREGHKEIVQVLLDNGANIEHQVGEGIENGFTATIENGFTALLFAAFKGHKEIVQILLDNNANIDHQSNAGYTALMAAAYRGHKEVVVLLLNRGANTKLKITRGVAAGFGACFLNPNVDNIIPSCN